MSTVSSGPVELNFDNNALSTNLHSMVEEGDVSPADAMESLMLALACEGVDLATLADAGKSTLDAIANQADDDDEPVEGEPSDAAYRSAANELCMEAEVDGDGAVSRGDECGSYVQCWFFVSNFDAERHERILEKERAHAV